MVFMGRHLSRSLVYQLKQSSLSRFFLRSPTNLSVYLGQPRFLGHKSHAYDDLSSKIRMKTNCMSHERNMVMKGDQSGPKKSYCHRRIYRPFQLKIRALKICLNQQRSFCKEAEEDGCYCKKLEDESCALKPLPKAEPKKCSRISRKRKHLLEQKKKAEEAKAPPQSQCEANLDEAVDELKYSCMLASEKKDCERRQYKALCEELRKSKQQGDPKSVDSLVKCMLSGIKKACVVHAEKIVYQQKFAEQIAAEEAERKERDKKVGKPLDCTKPNEEDDTIGAKNKAEKKKAKEKAELKRLLKEIKAKCKKQREEAERKKKEEEELNKKCKEAAAKKKCEELEAKKKCEEAAAKKKCEEAAAKKKCEEAAAKKKCEEAAAKKKCEEEAAKKKKCGANDATVKKCEADKKKKSEEAEKKKKSEEAALQKKCAEAKKNKACEAEKKKKSEESERKKDCHLAEFKKRCNELKKKIEEARCEEKNVK
ncbi:uncharacterized protein Dere_GG22474 [Drosophila erecta]|uniref:Axoneme-associated protein mst101(2) n=1 Tax=Drosophila erecta TaxID=7220 RepID=B3NRI1_DROER|nr:uncharacterized protein Dere_GG22474 [Drosophila erecta]